MDNRFIYRLLFLLFCCSHVHKADCSPEIFLSVDGFWELSIGDSMSRIPAAGYVFTGFYDGKVYFERSSELPNGLSGFLIGIDMNTYKPPPEFYIKGPSESVNGTVIETYRTSEKADIPDGYIWQFFIDHEVYVRVWGVNIELVKSLVEQISDFSPVTSLLNPESQ